VQNERKALLEKLYKRHLAKCTGRGALTLGTQETIPTETLHIPPISMTGFIRRPEGGSNVNEAAGADQSQL